MVLRASSVAAGTLLIVCVLFAGWDFLAGQGEYTPLLKRGGTYVAPFKQDERLQYEVYWKPLFFFPAFKAGVLEFRTEETSFEGREVYRVTAEARSSGRLPSVAGLEVIDYFESIFDRRTFQSYRLVKRIREGKRQRDFQLVFDYPRDRLHLTEHDVAVKPARELRNKSFSRIAEPLADIVSVFYVGRLKTFETGDQYYTYLVDEGESKRIEFTVAKQETLQTAIGNVKTIRINTNGRVFKAGGNLRVWYSTDELRFPVKFEADVSFGKVYGTLVAMDTGAVSRGLIRSH